MTYGDSWQYLAHLHKIMIVLYTENMCAQFEYKWAPIAVLYITEYVLE